MLTRTRIGLVIQAALTHPETVEALGHNVPRVFMLVFGGGTALAGLAGVIGGNAFVTEPSMAALVGSIIFVVVVVGGMGSLAGAFVASLLIGLIADLRDRASTVSLASTAGVDRRAGHRRDVALQRLVAEAVAGRAGAAVPAAGAGADLPAPGPDGHARGLTDASAGSQSLRIAAHRGIRHG